MRINFETAESKVIERTIRLHGVNAVIEVLYGEKEEPERVLYSILKFLWRN